MSKDRAEMNSIGVKVPKKWRQDLEEYARQNGYTLSYAVQKSVEAQVLSPDLPLQCELWRDFLEFRKDVIKALASTLTTLDSVASLLRKHDAEIGEMASIQKETASLLRSLNNRR